MRNPLRLPGRPGLAGSALVVLTTLSCATTEPSWTPESVAPPPLAEALEMAGAGESPPREVRLPLPPEEAESIQLTRDGAILTALTNNRGLEVAEFGPAISETLVPEARAQFDPFLTGTVSVGRNTQQLGGVSSFTFRRGSGSSSTPSLGNLIGATPEATAVNILGALADAAATRQPDPFLETRTGLADARAGIYLPTGTQVFLSGGVAYNDTNFTREEYEGNWAVGVNQALLEGFGLQVNLVALRQARNAAAQSVHAFRDDVIRTVRDVERAYWGLVQAKEVIRIREFGIELAEEQLRLNENLVEVGRAVEGAVMSARAELATRRADLVDAEAAFRSQTLELVRLLNPQVDDPDAVHFEPVDPPEIERVSVSPDVSRELALLYRPEVAQARLELANRELEVVRTRNGLLPRLDAFATYGRSSLGEDWDGAREFLDRSDFDNYQYGLEFEVPILNRAERARHRRARLSQDQAEASIRNLEQFVGTEVAQAAVEVERQWQRLGATQEAVESRVEELRVQQDRYSVGLSTNLDVLQVQRDLIEAQVNEVNARVGYIEALVALYAAEGTLLERRGVTLDIEGERPEVALDAIKVNGAVTASEDTDD